MNWMICYAWEDTDIGKATGRPQVKFGDHFVENAATLEEAFDRTRAYMRGSLGRLKAKWTDGRIRHDALWDVSAYAKTIGKFRKHAKIDDTIRKCIPNHIKNSDLHQVSYDDLVTYVNTFLHKQGQTLAEFGPSTVQFRAAVNVSDAVDAGKRTIIADLCPRFGKTTWSGMLTQVLESQLTIVASYVLTSFASFDKDLSSFEQFSDLVRVDATNDFLYQSKIDAALAKGKQVVVYLSMCNGRSRQTRIDYLFGLAQRRLIIVDEADFGVHQSAQAKPLIEARQADDIVILMTGTNSERAVADWKVDHTLLTTYPEMLIERKLSKAGPRKPETRKLKGFAVNRKRDEVVVPVEFYQFDLASIVAHTKKQMGSTFNPDLLSSWAKFAASPAQGKGFFVNMLEACFMGKHGCNDISTDIQWRPRGLRNALMFMSGSMTKADLSLCADYARQALGSRWVIVEMSGNEMSGRDAERLVNQAIDEATKQDLNVLVLSIGMGQRSFSVGRIHEVYLAYDSGEAGATTQKMARALTADGGQSKIGRVVSLSFDPNRDDKMDSIILATAANVRKAYGGTLPEALKVTLEHIDMFNGGVAGRVRIVSDGYLEQLIAFNRLPRVIGRASDFTNVTEEFIRALAACGGQYKRVKQTDATEKGRTGLAKSRTPSTLPKGVSWEKQMAKAREAVTTIVENVDVLVIGTQSATIDDAIAAVDGDREYQRSVEGQFGMPWTLVRDCLTEGIINRDMAELMLEAK